MILQQICHLPVLLTTRLFSPQAVLPNENTYGFIAVHVLKRAANTDGLGEEHNGVTARVCYSSGAVVIICLISVGLCPPLVVPGMPMEVAKLPGPVTKNRALWLQPSFS